MITREVADTVMEDLIVNTQKLTGRQCSRKQVKQTIRNLVRYLAHPNNGAQCADFDDLVMFVRQTMKSNSY